MNIIYHIVVKDLDDVVNSSNQLVVIDYSTTWCGPCKISFPKFMEMSEKYHGVLFMKCLGDEDPETSAVLKREGVRTVPSFHFWKNGKRREVITGALMEEVDNTIKELM